jgi:hypothetical protein
LALGASELLVTSLLYCAAAARASANIKKVEDEVRGLVTAQEMQANMLSTERQKLLQLEVDARQAQQAQRDAEERAQHAEAETHQHCHESKWPFSKTAISLCMGLTVFCCLIPAATSSRVR